MQQRLEVYEDRSAELSIRSADLLAVTTPTWLNVAPLLNATPGQILVPIEDNLHQQIASRGRTLYS